MNIFLDTTVTFSDPFFKRNYNRNLLKMARDYKDITFYMSEIVYKETKRHFERNVKENLEILHKTERKLQTFKLDYFTTEDNVKEKIDQQVKHLLNDFESFYNDLQENNSLYILTCPDDILPQLIDRSVNRIKPFKENKSEFRDAATWLTYTKYAEQEDLSNCYFITDNVTDFLDDKKETIHPDLLKDSKKFKHFLTLVKLTQEDEKVKKYIEEKQEKEQQFLKWVEEIYIDENYVLGYFKKSSLNGLFNQVYAACSDYISSLNRYKVYDEEFSLDGIDISGVQDLNIEVIAEEVIVSGELIIDADLTFHDKFESPSEKGLWIKDSDQYSTEYILPISFTLLNDLSISNVQLEEIKSVAPLREPRVDPTKYF
ncbi:PIN domain-containing protein [Priestia megaterium]|uniref:PIN domain-containing protein n=1 Tax=Priestia megaterium TaxID=1404 RepID=UPI002795C575|nr:PIN domain-containing protein [Priestia megaterium]